MLYGLRDMKMNIHDLSTLMCLLELMIKIGLTDSIELAKIRSVILDEIVSSMK